MKISALFPYKPDYGYRDLIWSYVQKRYERLLPDVEICVGIDYTEPFCRSKAVNDAAGKATGDVFIIADTDVIYDPGLIDRITAIISQHPWIIPFANGYKLSKKATYELLEKGLTSPFYVKREDIESNVTLEGAFMNVMTRKVFESVGGFDERFKGWGGEDNAFVISLDTIWGRHFRMNEDIYHLWHPSSKVCSEYYRNNLVLCNRYQAALGDIAEMRRLINEHEFMKQIHEIEGWLSDNEGMLLYSLAQKCTGSGVIVEIGSWKGKSTVWLGYGSKYGKQVTVYAIDPHTGSSEQKAIHDNVWTFDEFIDNIKKMHVDEIVKPIVKTSEEAAKDFNEPVELIFIDGAHEYSHVKKDFELWFPKVISGGIMAFHDVNHATGPNLVAKENIINSKLFSNPQLTDSILWATKV